jgi:hypothetical protein
MQSNTATVVSADLDLIEQLPVLLAGATIGVNGTKVTTAQAVAQVQAHLATLRQIDEVRVQLRMLVEQQRAERAALRPMVAAVENYVVSYLGSTSPAYGLLGFVARKHTAPSIEVAAAAVEKRLATRKKRHTMGKRQRAAIPPATLPTPPVLAPTTPTTPPTVHARDA